MAQSDGDNDRTDLKGGQHLTVAQSAKAGVAQLTELIGKQPLGVAAVEPAQGGFLVTVEVLEDSRIPSSADMLALYEAEIDDNAELVSYRRLKVYSRGQARSSE
ncbi:MAG: gas vesicle protein [Acidimicrobiaceae bacterium]|nr:gas vesicle protein [Acidimicrobiaceae bacterium]